MKYGKCRRKKTKSSWRNTLKTAKAAERQRRAEEARCQEEEAKWQAEEQRAREEQEEKKREGEKEKLKHERKATRRNVARGKEDKEAHGDGTVDQAS